MVYQWPCRTCLLRSHGMRLAPLAGTKPGPGESPRELTSRCGTPGASLLPAKNTNRPRTKHP
jgi:hypothetical protein